MDDRIDAALRHLAAEVVFPPTPDLRATVAQRSLRPARRPSWWPSAVPRAVALALVATLLIAAAATALVLALPGLRIILVPDVPTPEAADRLADRLALGVPVDPSTVTAGVPDSLGVPDEAYILGDHEVVTLVYQTTEGLPALANTDIGLLVQRIEGSLDRERVMKLVPETGASVAPVEVEGARGFWIEGPAHAIRYISPAGVERTEASRLVGDTLVWEGDGVLYRIESALGREATIRIAEGISP